jgi:hypothetical protein
MLLPHARTEFFVIDVVPRMGVTAAIVVMEDLYTVSFQ